MQITQNSCRKGEVSLRQIKDVSVIGNKILLLLSGIAETERCNFPISDGYASVKYSHTLIQQMLLYIAMSNSNGFVPIVLVEVLASEMGCSVRAVQQNNKVLADAGVLEWERLCSGCIQVRFHNYSSGVLDVHSEDEVMVVGEGERIFLELPVTFDPIKVCTTMSVERVSELVSLKDVNVLRVALRLLVFEKEANLRKQTQVYVSDNDIKQVLPRYLHFPKAINEVVEKLKMIFDIHVYNTREAVLEFVDNEVYDKTLSIIAGSRLVLCINVQKETPLQVSLKGIRDENKKTMVLDESFWEAVQYLENHTDFLCIQKKSGQTERYLHYAYLERQLYNNGWFVDIESLDSQDWFRACRFVFPEDNIIVMRHLRHEARKRKKWKVAR